jgi:hypothetical protein
MSIKVTVELTKPFDNLHVYDHIGGNKELPYNANGDLGTFGPCDVETNGSSARTGKLLFRYGDPDDPFERIFDVHEGVNELPPHDTFADFAKFVVLRGQPDKGE